MGEGKTRRVSEIHMCIEKKVTRKQLEKLRIKKGGRIDEE